MKKLTILFGLVFALSLTAYGGQQTTANNSAIENTAEGITGIESSVESSEPVEISTTETETTETETTEIEAVESETIESEEVNSEEALPTYTYTDMEKTLYAQASVSLRDLPCKEGNKVGSLSQNEEVKVTGQCNETGWYRLDSGNFVTNSRNTLAKAR